VYNKESKHFLSAYMPVHTGSKYERNGNPKNHVETKRKCVLNGAPVLLLRAGLLRMHSSVDRSYKTCRDLQWNMYGL